MKTIDHAFFKQLLEEELSELTARARSTVSSFIREEAGYADLVDQAARDHDRNYTIRIRDRESHLIKKIKVALDKIEDGTFGICEDCGEEIGLARLMARPVTAHCIKCKTKMEAYEKASGL